MANPEAQGVRLVFPSMPADVPAWELPGFVSDLNAVYEVLVLASAAGYEQARLPRAVRVRRTSLLVPEDRLLVRRIDYGSPWQVDLVVAAVETVQGWTWPVASLAALKFLPDFFDRGVDLVEKVATWRHRTRMRELEEAEAAERTRQLELENEHRQLDLLERRRAASHPLSRVESREQEGFRRSTERARSGQEAPSPLAGEVDDAQLVRQLRAPRDRVLSTAQGSPETEPVPDDHPPDRPNGSES